MSGIYIPGIEMPKRCNECRFLEGDNMDGLCHAADRWMDDEDYWAWYVYEEGDIDTVKPANCPLIAVPNHGRLIDADAFIKEQEERYCKDCAKRKGTKKGKECFAYEIGEAPCRSCGTDDAKSDIEYAPTIIPADKEGE